VVEATANEVMTYSFDTESKVMTVGFQDLHMVSSGGVDVFALNLNDWPNPPPFYLEVSGRLFSLQPSNTYLVTGHGSQLPEWITAEEAEDRLTVLVERNGRYLVYGHDTLVTEDDADADEAEATE
jgi:hypothetical protein